MLNILAVAPQDACALQKDGHAVQRPGRRGERSCLSSGRLHETNGSCSWISPDREIDYSFDKSQASGLVRLDRRDICNGTRLRKGDHVVFFLYADLEHGLSAEGCCLKSRAVMRMTEAPLWLLDNEDSDEEEFFTPGKRLETEDVSDGSSSTVCLSDSEEEPVEEEPCEEPCDEDDLCREALPVDEREPCGEPCEEPCDDEPSCQACLQEPLEHTSRGSALRCQGVSCRPCTFFRWGCCPNGDNCDKCHMPHGVRFGVNPMDFADSDDEF